MIILNTLVLKIIKYCMALFVLVYGLYYMNDVVEMFLFRPIPQPSPVKKFDAIDYPREGYITAVVRGYGPGAIPSLVPIYDYYYQHKVNNEKICWDSRPENLFIIVKSAMKNFEQRQTIRETYGHKKAMPGKAVRIAFFIGVHDNPVSADQKKIQTESVVSNDIVQGQFRDTNDTMKTFLSFIWVLRNCPSADAYLITNDDMYISLDNLFQYMGEKKLSPNFYFGHKFKSSPHIVEKSKMDSPLDEYPWTMWPPYISSCAYVLSWNTLRALLYSSMYVRHFRFDDIYLGIVAMKSKINLIHSSRFYVYKKKYSLDGYRDVIASHGYGDHEELVRVWNEQHNAFMKSH